MKPLLEHDEYLKQRESLVAAYTSSIKEYDKLVTWASAGALGLSISFFEIAPGRMIIANAVREGQTFDKNFADAVIFHESGPPSGWPLGHILRTLNNMTRDTVESFADCF